jgi:hypothetical protein
MQKEQNIQRPGQVKAGEGGIKLAQVVEMPFPQHQTPGPLLHARRYSSTVSFP